MFLIPHQVLNDAFTALCVIYFMISYFETQPKDYGCLMLQNSYSSLCEGALTLLRCYIPQKIWIRGSGMVYRWCLRWEPQSHTFSVLLYVSAGCRSAKTKKVLVLTLFPSTSGKNKLRTCLWCLISLFSQEQSCSFPGTMVIWCRDTIRKHTVWNKYTVQGIGLRNLLHCRG